MNELEGFVHEYIAKRGPRTFLLLHGTGGTERDLIDLAASLDGNANILAPRGRVIENGMARFFRR